MTTRSLQFRFNDVDFDIEIDSNERTISEHVEKTGGWEQNQLILYDLLIPEGGCMVDIGANVGINSIYAAHRIPRSRVIAVEGSEANAEILGRNISASGVGDRVEVVCAAIADRDGRIGFLGAGTNAHIDLAGGEGHGIEAMTLDSLAIRSRLHRVHLLKIDVEGYTDLVFAKSADFLRITDSAIVEFSFGDILNRFGFSEPEVHRHASLLVTRLAAVLPYTYYIARREPPVRFLEPSEVFDIIRVESPVGDVLFTRHPISAAITSTAFLARKTLELMAENHRRYLEVLELRGQAATRDG
jgi:FkbM family methyltransferase